MNIALEACCVAPDVRHLTADHQKRHAFVCFNCSKSSGSLVQEFSYDAARLEWLRKRTEEQP